MRIAIVGGGVVGLSCALALRTKGAEVLVLDPEPRLVAASWNNAGHIATEQVAPLASPAIVRTAWSQLFVRGGALALPPLQVAHWLPFALRVAAASRPAAFRGGRAALGALLAEAMPAWTRMAQVLGDPGLIRTDGHLVVWESARSAVVGRAAWASADTGTATVGDPSDRDRRLLAQLLPAAPPAGTMRLAGTGQVRDLSALASALRCAVTDAGGVIVPESARIVRSGTIAGVDGHAADAVLITAGAASGTAMRALGHRVPMIAERGYHIRAGADGWPADAPPIVFEDRSMIVTRYDDAVQAASFVEFAAPDAPPDPRKWRRLERHVRALGLPMREPFARWMGARPTLPDYLPAIGRSRRAANLFYAFGHQHLGLTLAPATAEAVAALMAGQEPSVDLGAFDIARFERGSR